jgi:hypothetical protein
MVLDRVQQFTHMVIQNIVLHSRLYCSIYKVEFKYRNDDEYTDVRLC